VGASLLCRFSFSDVLVFLGKGLLLNGTFGPSGPSFARSIGRAPHWSVIETRAAAVALSNPFTLIIELDAWNIRERDQWGLSGKRC
jgi:hypothetical protein